MRKAGEESEGMEMSERSLLDAAQDEGDAPPESHAVSSLHVHSPPGLK